MTKGMAALFGKTFRNKQTNNQPNNLISRKLQKTIDNFKAN